MRAIASWGSNGKEYKKEVLIVLDIYFCLENDFKT